MLTVIFAVNLGSRLDEEHTDVPAAWECHVHRAWHVAPNSPDLNPVELRCLGCPSADGLSTSTFMTINQLSSLSGANCRIDPAIEHWHFTRRYTWGVVGSLVIMLLRIFSWFWQWKNFENRLIFDKVKAFNETVTFLGRPVCVTVLCLQRDVRITLFIHTGFML